MSWQRFLCSKKDINPEEQWGGVGIYFLDYPTISRAFKAFVDRIRDTIPNLDAQTSVLGGYSNGANVLALLLSVLDPPTLKSFKHFFFIDCTDKQGIQWRRIRPRRNDHKDKELCHERFVTS
jgi:hypothetical protein